MSTAASILLGAFILLLAVHFLGVAIPNIVLGVFGILAGILVIASALATSRTVVP